MIASLESIPPPTITVQMSCVHGSATTGAVALDRDGEQRHAGGNGESEAVAMTGRREQREPERRPARWSC